MSLKSFVTKTMDNLRRLNPAQLIAQKRPEDLDDNELLQRCIDGDDKAMSAFVSRFSGYIHTIVGRTVRKYVHDIDPTVIDDLAQEVFINLFEDDRRRLKTFEGRNGSPLKAWLRVIAMRSTISKMRRWKKYSQLPNDDSDRGSSNLVHEGPTATQMLAAQDELTRKGKLLALAKSLPPEDQLLIEMIYVQEMAVPDIIKTLRIRRGAFYMSKNRALVRLRQHAKSAGLMS